MQARAELLNSPVHLDRAATTLCVFTTCNIVKLEVVFVQCQRTMCSGMYNMQHYILAIKCKQYKQIPVSALPQNRL